MVFRKIGAGATHKKSQPEHAGVCCRGRWLAYYVLQYPFVARRASDVHWVRSRLCERRRGLGYGRAMTTLTMRLVKGHFIVSGPDVEPMKSRAGARRETGARRIILARRSRRVGPGGKRAPRKKPGAPSDRDGWSAWLVVDRGRRVEINSPAALPGLGLVAPRRPIGPQVSSTWTAAARQCAPRQMPRGDASQTSCTNRSCATAELRPKWNKGRLLKPTLLSTNTPRLFCNARHNVDEGRYSVSADEFAGANNDRHQSEEKEKGDPGPADRCPEPQPADEQKRDRIGTHGQYSQPIRHARRDLVHVLCLASR